MNVGIADLPSSALRLPRVPLSLIGHFIFMAVLFVLAPPLLLLIVGTAIAAAGLVWLVECAHIPVQHAPVQYARDRVAASAMRAAGCW